MEKPGRKYLVRKIPKGEKTGVEKTDAVKTGREKTGGKNQWEKTRSGKYRSRFLYTKRL